MFSYLLAGVIVVLAASWTYQVNYRVQEAKFRVEKLARAIDREREAISVLGAEWAYLNRPGRLRALAETYYEELRLMPIESSNFGEVGQISFAQTDGTERLVRSLSEQDENGEGL
ncbi:MAG: cell division protein FtsL [Rhodobacteraceae bacterium]|nr:cell division protein FtsL [Paracoccaceae bacterium]